MIIYVNTVQYTNVRKCTVSNKKRNLFRKDYSESYRIKMDIVEKIVKNCLIYSSFGEGFECDLRACCGDRVTPPVIYHLERLVDGQARILG